MTDLSQRIMDVWLAVNPEPNVRGDPSWTPWREKEYHLQHMLACDAYESAVIQFLVPDRYKRNIAFHINPMSIDMGGNDYKASIGGYKARGSGRCFAEALLNAIEAIEQ